MLPSPTRHPTLLAPLAPLALLLAATAPAMADSSAPSTLPKVDFSKMGTVGLGGSFSGLDWWSDDSPYASSSSSETAFSTDGDTLFYRTAEGGFKALASTDAGGTISALCWSAGTDDSSNGTLYIGGTFTTLSGTDVHNVASFALTDSSVKALGSGLSGEVDTVYCDDDNSQVWFGGSFDAPTGTGGNVALWSTASNTWETPAFGGLNGRVESISPSSNGSSIYFGGDFTISYVSNTTFLSNSSSTTNSTSGNTTSVESAPGNTTTVGNSGYLTPLTVSASSSSTASYQIQAGPSTDQSEYSNTDVLLCPDSGIWLAQDNTIANVNIVGQSYLSATGIRVVNGFAEGRGTTTFCFTMLPWYADLNMTYTDPYTGEVGTCTTHCPLYNTSSTSGQDFIFTEGTQNLTGFEMQLKGWLGSGAGLSSVTLLTDGAYISAASSSDDTVTCSSGSQNNGSIQTTGDWETKTIATDSSTESYLVATNSVANPTYPSVTFYPYVSSAGNYDIYVFIPGCINAGDCNSRTSVDIEVFPFSGGMGWTSTISEQVDYDTKTLVYSGTVGASTDDFSPTVSLALSSSPAKPARGNRYTVVADKVQMTLTSLSGQAANATKSTTSSSPVLNGTTAGAPLTNGTTTINSTSLTNLSYNIAYGVYEWPRTVALNVNAATSALSNVTETPLARLGFSLDAALNASGSDASAWVVNTIVAHDNTVFVGGDFSSTNNYTNVLSIDASSGQASALASQGLGGIVNTAVVADGYIFFGGDFTATASSGETGLKYVARYDPSSKAWAALGGGVDGLVTDLLASTTSTTQVIVIGNFTNVINADGSTNQTGGFAIWDDKEQEWTTTGVLFGNVSAGAVPSSSHEEAYFAGKVYGSASNAVNGVAVLSTGSDGSATISSLSGVSFGTAGSASTSSNSTSTRRSLNVNSMVSRSWFARFTDALVERTLPGLLPRATAPTIVSATYPAPAVLAGAYWTNSSASGKPTVTILGGNFTSSSGNVEGVAFHAKNDDALTGPSTAVTGVVRALDVVGNKLYVGGEGVTVDGVGSGLVVYDLEAGSWMTSGMASLNAASGSDVIVNQISTRPNTNTIVVAGNFASAGSLNCAAVCLWDSEGGRWSTPGSGLSSGEVRSLDYAGTSYDTLIVAGSFVLSDGTVASVASYNFGNSSWTGLGSLNGPALAVVADDKNATNVFAAGYSSSDGSPFLEQWNGATWTAQNGSLQSGSLVQQLAFVPMSTEHTAQGSIENDRMLLVSGDLYLENMGNATSALYDGANWYPYLVGSSSSGGIGAGSSLFWSDSDFSFKVKHFLARGLVVLVAIAIATGLILLFILLMLLLAYFNRRRDSRAAQERQEVYGKEGSIVSSTHQNVFANVQAALEASLVGGGLAGAGVAAATTKKRESAQARDRLSNPSSYNSGAYPIGSDAGGYADDDEEAYERETTMRYDFDGPELQEGEMAMKAGQAIVILDDEQSHEWWYARDPATGREGMIPATYVW